MNVVWVQTIGADYGCSVGAHLDVNYGCSVGADYRCRL